MTTKRSSASSASELERKLLRRPLTFGEAVEALRARDQITQAAFAKKIGISRQYLCDVEKGRRLVSPEQAARFAKAFGHPARVLVQLSSKRSREAEHRRRLQKRNIVASLQRLMEKRHVGPTELARRMVTSRNQINRLLDPADTGVSLRTIDKATKALQATFNLVIAERTPRPAFPAESRRTTPALPGAARHGQHRTLGLAVDQTTTRMSNDHLQARQPARQRKRAARRYGHVQGRRRDA